MRLDTPAVAKCSCVESNSMLLTIVLEFAPSGSLISAATEIFEYRLNAPMSVENSSNTAAVSRALTEEAVLELFSAPSHRLFEYQLCKSLKCLNTFLRLVSSMFTGASLSPSRLGAITPSASIACPIISLSRVSPTAPGASRSIAVPAKCSISRLTAAMSVSKNCNSRSSAAAFSVFLRRLSIKNSCSTPRDAARDSKTIPRCFSPSDFTSGVSSSNSSRLAVASWRSVSACFARFIASTMAFTAAFGTS
mmetsp:Transcript_136/g.564  ORF Transcript_136/g.564 Transcript_136/m.564 type:complete len:250 (-) Transcript_136:446-1195(-)